MQLTINSIEDLPQLAQKVIELTNSKSKIINMALPQDDPTQRQPNISLAKKELNNWEPKVQLNEGLIKIEKIEEEQVEPEVSLEDEKIEEENSVLEEQPKEKRKSFLEKFTERFKEFLDNAE